AYDYLAKLKNKSSLSADAYLGYLNVKYLQIVSQINPDRAELERLDSLMGASLNEASPKDSYQIILSQAKIKSYYLNKHSEAIDLISKAIASNKYRQNNNDLKLLLGDIYLLNSNPWDATLVYAQVEKSNAQPDVVSEARFRKAKVAYYIGQFSWAQAQLDVLKAGTSKLISNDALELSLFISENYDMDTTETTMRTFALADLYTFSKQYEKALLCLDSISQKFSNHSLNDDVLYRKALIFEQTSDLHGAAQLYNEIYTKYKFDILADNSLFKYAKICEKLNQKDEAKDAYFKLITEFPGSIFTVEARKRLRNLSNGATN
ncbi:MAG: tetratricopeptide repeat protein, partial [Bacteroidales bacterium]|nr:tetratricopeptide repeat protein [Bacteroidales bacterium]